MYRAPVGSILDAVARSKMARTTFSGREPDGEALHDHDHV